MRRSVVFTAVVAAIALAPAGVASAAVSSPCPGDKGDPTTSGWALSTTTFDNAYTRPATTDPPPPPGGPPSTTTFNTPYPPHPYAGNASPPQRVPATGTGYVET